MNNLQHLHAVFHHYLEWGYYTKSKKQENTNANIIANHLIQHACETNAGPWSKTTEKAVASALVKALLLVKAKSLHCCSVGRVDFNTCISETQTLKSTSKRGHQPMSSQHKQLNFTYPSTHLIFGPRIFLSSTVWLLCLPTEVWQDWDSWLNLIPDSPSDPSARKLYTRPTLTSLAMPVHQAPLCHSHFLSYLCWCERLCRWIILGNSTSCNMLIVSQSSSFPATGQCSHKHICICIRKEGEYGNHAARSSLVFPSFHQEARLPSADTKLTIA